MCGKGFSRGAKFDGLNSVKIADSEFDGICMNSKRLLTIALIAGEASGDLLGAHLIQALKQHYPNCRFVGIAGPLMQKEGCESLYPQEALAVRGFVEVIKRLPTILKIRKGVVARLTDMRPDVFIGIDAPDFNLTVAQRLKDKGIPTVHYVSPSVWAWRRERVNKIVHQVNRVLCLFPMEPPLYVQAGGKADFVGHPLAQTLPLVPDQSAARTQLKLEEAPQIITLMPGSRVSEVDYMAPIFLETVPLILRQYPQAQFLIPAATTATRERLLALLDNDAYKKLPIRVMSGHATLACVASDVVLVASGTATLEVALCKRPMVISYKISSLTYHLVKHKIKVPHVGLPNILLNRSVVPELLQHDATPHQLADAVMHWLSHPDEVLALQAAFTQLHHTLKLNTDELAAKAVLEEAKVW